MGTSQLMQLMYISRAKKHFTKEELEELVAKANSNNRHIDVTGSLVYNDGVFLQVLEGEQKKLLDLYNIIKEDERHHKVTKIYFEPAETRLFSKWFMHLASLEKSDSKDLTMIKNMMANIDDGKINGIAAPTAVLKAFSSL